MDYPWGVRDVGWLSLTLSQPIPDCLLTLAATVLHSYAVSHHNTFKLTRIRIFMNNISYIDIGMIIIIENIKVF